MGNVARWWRCPLTWPSPPPAAPLRPTCWGCYSAGRAGTSCCPSCTGCTAGTGGGAVREGQNRPGILCGQRHRQRDGMWKHSLNEYCTNLWVEIVDGVRHDVPGVHRLPGKINMFITLTSLLRKLQAQTLPDEAPPVGKVHPFSKIAVTFEPIQQFWCPLRFRISEKCQYSLFCDWKYHY